MTTRTRAPFRVRWEVECYDTTHLCLFMEKLDALAFYNLLIDSKTGYRVSFAALEERSGFGLRKWITLAEEVR